MDGAITIRKSRRSDLPSMVDIVTHYRKRLAQIEPQFWRPASRARQKTRLFFALLMWRRNWMLVAERDRTIIGFLIALPQPTPPVFDPGTKTALIDDFCVADGEDFFAVGGALLNAVRPLLREAGYGQVVVINAVGDTERGVFLEAQGIRPVSQWSRGQS